MIVNIDGLCIKVCKFQTNEIKLRCTWFVKTDPYSLKMTTSFLFIYGSQNPQHIYAVHRAELRTGKVWCKSVYNF